MKKFIKIGAVVLSMALAMTTLASCADAYSQKKKYLDAVDSYTFWSNDLSQSIPQPNIGKMVEKFLAAPSADSKAKKVAIIGYDGCRSETLVNVLESGATDPKDKNKGDYSGHKEESVCSGINKLVKEGGKVYHTFAGGYKGEENEQHCSTAPGWAAILTGAWGIENGITDNGMPKSINHKTLLLKAAEDYGMSTTFCASWEPHFTENYVDEIQYLKENPQIPMNFNHVETDAALHEYLLDCVTVGSPNEKDIIFGIYEATDHNGHNTGFGNRNSKYVTAFRDEDERCYQLLNAIQNRSTYDQEDWLIVVTADHGGIKTWHGGQTIEERSTWLVCNKPIDEKYFVSGYDGYNLKK